MQDFLIYLLHSKSTIVKMRYSQRLIVSCLSFLILSQSYVVALARRAIDLTCSDLRVKSNNGDRKIAIVIDSSGSMGYSDPSDLRLEAGQALNSWLINSKEAKSGQKSDLVTVIDFDDEATLDYALGDPGPAANSSFGGIGSNGGTYIASGVEMAITELTKAGSGTTAGRSGIIVFTDGEDSSTAELVDQINNATAKGIRVSFGFLDSYAGYQDKDIVVAIGKSGGVYSTITSEDSSNNFINYAILNGLTTNDNPNGNNSTLLAGLATAHFTGGSQTQSITYNARAHEHIDFIIETVDAGPLKAELLFGGKVQNTTNVTGSFDTGNLAIKTSNSGQIEIKVTATNAPNDSIFIISATSDMPPQNCTVGIGPSGGSGLEKGAKIGIGIGVPFVVGLLGLGSYLLWKHLHHAHSPAHHIGQPSWDQPAAPAMANQPGAYLAAPPPTYPPKPSGLDPHHSVHSVPSVSDLSDSNNGPPNPPQDNKKHRIRFQKRSLNKEYHHHHLDPYHPCNVSVCQLVNPQHVCVESRCLCVDATAPIPNHRCAEIRTPCACTDQNCPLNDPKHECQNPDYPCTCLNENCPLTEEQKKKRYADAGLGGLVKGANAFGNHIM